MNKNSITFALISFSVMSIYFGFTFSSLFGRDQIIPDSQTIISFNETQTNVSEETIINQFTTVVDKYLFEDDKEKQMTEEMIENIIKENNVNVQVIEMNETDSNEHLIQEPEVDKENETNNRETIEVNEVIIQNDQQLLNETKMKEDENDEQTEVYVEMKNETEVKQIEIQQEENGKSNDQSGSKYFKSLLQKASEKLNLSSKSIVLIVVPSTLAFILSIISHFIF